MTRRPVPAAASLLVLDNLMVAVEPTRTMTVLAPQTVDESRALESLPWSDAPSESVGAGAVSNAFASPTPTTFPFKRSSGLAPSLWGSLRAVTAAYALGFTPKESKLFAGHFLREGTGRTCSFLGSLQGTDRPGAKWTFYAGVMYDTPGDLDFGTYLPIPVAWVESDGAIVAYRWLPEGRGTGAVTDKALREDNPFQDERWFATAIGDMVVELDLPLAPEDATVGNAVPGSISYLNTLVRQLDTQHRTRAQAGNGQSVYFAAILHRWDKHLTVAVALAGTGFVVTYWDGEKAVASTVAVSLIKGRMVWKTPVVLSRSTGPRSDAQIVADLDLLVLKGHWLDTVGRASPDSSCHYAAPTDASDRRGEEPEFDPASKGSEPTTDIAYGDKFEDTYGVWVVQGRARGTTDSWEIRNGGREIVVSGGSLRDHYTRVQGETPVPTDVVERYSSGGCIWLALALNKRYGWPIYAEVEGADIAHAYVKHPSGLFIDILGPQKTMDTFGGGASRVVGPLTSEGLQSLGGFGMGPGERPLVEEALLVVDKYVVPKLRALDTMAPVESPAVTAAPTTAPANDSTFELPGYGTIRVVLGAKGQRDVWHNIYINEKRHGWNGRRWSQKTVPPAAVVAAVVGKGYTVFPGGGAAVVDDDAPAATSTTDTNISDSLATRSVRSLPGVLVLMGSSGSATAYGNRTAAEARARALGPPWKVYQPMDTPGFYVGRPVVTSVGPFPPDWIPAMTFWLKSVLALTAAWGGGPASDVIESPVGALYAKANGHTVTLRMFELVVDKGLPTEASYPMPEINRRVVPAAARWLAPWLGIPYTELPEPLDTNRLLGNDYSYRALGSTYNDTARFHVGYACFDPMRGYGGDSRFVNAAGDLVTGTRSVNATGFVVWLTPRQLTQLVATLPPDLHELPEAQARMLTHLPPELVVVRRGPTNFLVKSHRRGGLLNALDTSSSMSVYPVHVFLPAEAYPRPTREQLVEAVFTSADQGSEVRPVAVALDGTITLAWGVEVGESAGVRPAQEAGTHDIAGRGGERLKATTLYREGQYAVHKSDTVDKGEPPYIVSHLPSGMEYARWSDLAEAKRFVDFVSVAAADVGADTPFGKAPSPADRDELLATRDLYAGPSTARTTPVSTPRPVTPQLPPPLPTAAYVPSKPAAPPPKPVPPPKPPRPPTTYVTTAAGVSPISVIRKQAAAQGYPALECTFEAIAYKDQADYDANMESHQGMTDMETVEYLQGEARYLAAGRVWDVFVYRKKGRTRGELLTNIPLLFA